MSEPQSEVKKKKRQKHLENKEETRGRKTLHSDYEIITVLIPKYLEFCSLGFSDSGAAGSLGLSLKYLREIAKRNKDFSDAMEQGPELREAFYTKQGLAGMVGHKKIQPELFRILARNIAKWDQRPKDEDEKTIEDENGDVTFRARFGE